jgi:hypothetical protein
MENLKIFVLIFDDNTSTTTQHYDIEEVKKCYLNSNVLVYLEPRDVRFCVNVVELLPSDEIHKSLKDKEIVELKHRLNMIKDDLSQIIDFIDEERMMEAFNQPTKVSDSAWNLISNIEIACDLENKECLNWKKFN